MSDPIPGWEPHYFVCMAFGDDTGEDRNPIHLAAFLDDVSAAANKHGFSVHKVGTRSAFYEFLSAGFIHDKPLGTKVTERLIEGLQGASVGVKQDGFLLKVWVTGYRHNANRKGRVTNFFYVDPSGVVCTCRCGGFWSVLPYNGICLQRWWL